MFLEIIDLPNLDIRGGALASAREPWTKPIAMGPQLRETVLRAVHDWHARLGVEPTVRLVCARAEEWMTLRHEPEILRFAGVVTPQHLAEYFGIDSIIYPRGDAPTQLECAAASDLRSFALEIECTTGTRPVAYKVTDETSRSNLARAAALAGLRIVVEQAVRS